MEKQEEKFQSDIEYCDELNFMSLMMKNKISTIDIVNSEVLKINV